jgi:two-component system chemotaxis response regulator CheB
MAIKKAKPGLVWREAIALNQDHPVHSVRPAADVTMNAVAEAYGPNTIGVVLTGMGCDGAFGLRNIKSSGGRTIACDEKTSIIFGMPKAAIELGCVDRVLPLESIAAHIIRSL